MTNNPDIPIIKLITIDNKYYFYDTCTNNIIEVSKEHYIEINILIKMGIRKYCKLNKDTSAYRAIRKLIALGFLKPTPIKKVENLDNIYIPQMVNRCLNSLILQTSKDCNFKCRYCSYSHNNNIDRLHEKKEMSWDIAKSCVDYLFDHSQDAREIFISFYGGEPMLTMSLIRKVVEYVEQQYIYKKVYFNITTNGSLLSKENITFFSNHKFVLVISLDGPEHIQNKHRSFFKTGLDTYNIVYQNILLIKKMAPDYFNTYVKFNAVCMLDEDTNEIKTFFRGLGVEERNVKIEYADMQGNDYIYNTFSYRTDGVFEKTKVDFDYLYDENVVIPETWHHNGSCVPSIVRLFVNVQGDFFSCEKVIESANLSIGNNISGINIEKVVEFANIAKISGERCINCWGLRFCRSCLIHCVNVETGNVCKLTKHNNCNMQLAQIENYLKNKIHERNVKNEK